MANKARHAFGSSSGIDSAIQSGKIDAYDILFLDGDTDHPTVGWVDKNGKAVILKDEKADLTELEAEVAKKADAEEVAAEIAKKADVSALSDVEATAKAYTDGKVEAAVKEHLVKKYEVSDTPDGTLVDYRDGEIRIMCKNDAVFTKQSVGTGGDPNCYYITFKTYVFDDSVVGYREHLSGQSDKETLTDLKTDKFGRRYQPTWLAIAKHDEATDTWTYYGANSTNEKMIGWDYRIDFYDDNDTMISSDSIRINLANEDCYFANEPYYVGSMMKEVDVKIEEKIAEVESAYEIIEF